MQTKAREATLDSDGVLLHEEEIVDLVARALAGRELPDVAFDDPAARRILDALEIDRDRYDRARLRSALATTMVIDALVRDFFERQRGGLAIGVNQGLSTRFERLDDGVLRWIDVERPQVAAFKASLVAPCERHLVATCCSLRCAGWTQCLRAARDVPTIIVAQGTLRRATHEELDAFLVQAAKDLGPGTELVLDYDARSPLRPSALGRSGACLESPSPDGAVVRYPRVRYVSSDEYAPDLAHAVSGVNGVSRLFRGRGVASLAHLRFV
ncbi:MAG: class I SAM-dependent methyltransferase [Labilithrix sp.]|nr:class I SAM-dependent methyltransferase [Labilithrix sp.]MBX3211297.1 class I SAM-dependent methyltransferase [Labilithrix sp.]